MIVVSDIGEQWSPHTAPAIHAEMEMIIIFSLLPANTATTIGMSMPNVPHDVPVANARKQPTRNMIAGSSVTNPLALDFIMASTYAAAPRLSVIAFRDQASVRIRIAGTMALNPSGIQDIHSPNFITRLTT